VLLAMAGLFLRALDRARTLDPGFDTSRVAIASLDLPLSGYTLKRGRVFVRQLLEELRARPDVEAASFADHLTLALGASRTSYSVEGRQAPPVGWGEVGMQQVGPDWFRVLGLPIVRGRGFAETDRHGAPGVVIVNETFAKTWWPGREAVGRRISWSSGGGGPWLTVVGVARDTKYFSLGESPQPFVYAPHAQGANREATIAVRSKLAPGAMAAEIARIARRLDPNLLVYDVMPIEQHLGVTLLPVRLVSTVLAAMGAVALLIAGVGLFGLMAYDASQRRREIGLRMALGASRGAVVRLVLRDGLRMVLVGVILGAAAAAALAQIVRGQLYGVPPLDPVTYLAIAVLLIATGLAACGIPARAASRVEPMLVLRHD
jgi:putative ABC transport system permease protein